MRTKKRLSKFQVRLRRLAFFLISMIIIIVVFFEMTVRDRIELAIIAEVKTVSHTAINNAVNDYLSSNRAMCDELVKLNADDTSKIQSVSENIYNVNVFKTNISNMAQSYIDKAMYYDGIDVKLGNFSGLTILSDFGPPVHFNIESTPTVSCEILSSFESAGVNQTIHHIELEVYVDIYVGNPIRIESIKFDSRFEIAQTVIIGNIPSAYGTISRY